MLKFPAFGMKLSHFVGCLVSRSEVEPRIDVTHGSFYCCHGKAISAGLVSYLDCGFLGWDAEKHKSIFH